MIISLLIIAIGLIPLVLAINTIRIYKGSELGIILLLFMMSLSFWQIDIGVLYLKSFLPEDWILWLFRLFRMGPTFIVPITFYLAYVIFNKYALNFATRKWYKFTRLIINAKVLKVFILWSIFIYFLNWTNFGVSGLRIVHISNSDINLFFPVYGDYHFLYLIHTSMFLALLLFIIVVSTRMRNMQFQSFLQTFSICSLLLFITGFINFIPGTGAVVSSIGVIVFSSIIIFSFVRMNNLITIKYNRLLERQKKLNYTGDLSASLIHEVKNNLQIIKTYSQLLPREEQLSSQGKLMIEKVQNATSQLDNLTNSYSDYINTKTIEFKLRDMNSTIISAIEITSEILKENHVTIKFIQNQRPLKAFINETYLKQVFINIIKNSCESIDGQKDSRLITIQTQVIGDQILIDLSDTGEGIPEHQWESIFDPFLSSKQLGMGVGLPFVRKIIFEHRGEIKVLKSSPEGTTFRIVLPQYEFSEIS
ncbi:sensor histidine kinase [Bacillus sp. FJAT-45037]|uniref:sensor histidine kinase n=1 Tax=Bacillus sp. FJAT-45037 TaxID=2011007 RepID=UPI000C24C71C|nr:HAMP domain-containing sensor histidine kinase [Bacillus sp. FJAT-45037]